MMNPNGAIRWAAVGLAALLAGCVSAPTPVGPGVLWQPPGRAVSRGEEWQAARTEQPDLSRPRTLAELADLALRRHPASRKAWNDARAAAARVEAARGTFMPAVVGTAGASLQSVEAQPDSFDQDTVRVGPGLQVNYLVLSFGGGRSAAVEAALQTVYAADYAFNRSLQDVLLGVETAYYGLVSAEAGIAAAEANLKDARTALEAAKTRLNAGAGTRLDVLQSQANVDESLYALASVQGQLQAARGALAVAVGAPADTPVKVVPPAEGTPPPLSSQDISALIDRALQRRPDIAALRATVAAKQAAATAVGANLWPSLYFNGSVSRTQYDNDGEKPMQDRDWSYLAGLSLQWTLFDGFQTLSARRAARAEVEAVQAVLAQAELAASADVWFRFHAHETALKKVAASAAVLASASASHNAALDSYRNGVKSLLDVLNAESLLAQARSQQIAARLEAFASFAQLAHAVGLLGTGRSE